MAETKKMPMFYGSGRMYCILYDQSTFPVVDMSGSEVDLTELKAYLADNVKSENIIGYLKGGAKITVSTEKLEDKSDLGEMKVDLIKEETSSFEFALFDSNPETIAKLYPTAANKKSAEGDSFTAVGGLDNMDEKSYVLIFRKQNSNVFAIMVGKNTSGFENAWNPDSVTPLNVAYQGQPFDESGRFYYLVEFKNDPTSTT